MEGGGAFGKMGRGKEKGKGSGGGRRHKLFSLWWMIGLEYNLHVVANFVQLFKGGFIRRRRRVKGWSGYGMERKGRGRKGGAKLEVSWNWVG